MPRKFIIAGIVLILLLVVVFFVFIIIGQKNSNTNSSALQNPISQNTTFFPFSVSYPSNWSANTVTRLGNETFYIKPTNSSLTNPLPSLSIDKHQLSDKTMLENKIKSFQLQGYKTHPTSFNNETVQVSEGKFPIMIEVDGKKTDFYEGMFIYPYGQYVYLVDYKYAGDSKNLEMEQMFAKILSSIKVN